MISDGNSNMKINMEERKKLGSLTLARKKIVRKEQGRGRGISMALCEVVIQLICHTELLYGLKLQMMHLTTRLEVEESERPLPLGGLGLLV